MPERPQRVETGHPGRYQASDNSISTRRPRTGPYPSPSVPGLRKSRRQFGRWSE